MNNKEIGDWKEAKGKGFFGKGYLLNKLVIVYVIFDLLIIHFDLGKNDFCKKCVGATASIVPSILTTSSLTSMPDSAALILAMSWVLVVFAPVLMILFANWEEVDYEGFYKKVSNWQIFLIFIFIPGLLIFMMQNTPPDSGVFGKMLVQSLRSSIYFLILYGTGIWLCLSAGLFFMVFNFNYLINVKNNGRTR